MDEQQLEDIKQEDKGSKMISASIPMDVWSDARRLGVTFRELIMLGLLAKKDNPALIERVRTLEKANDKLHKLLTNCSEHIAELEDKLAEMTK